MFVSLMAEIQVERTLAIPLTHGEAMQAELLRQVAELTPEGAAQLHGGRDGQVRAYTISPLRTDCGVVRDHKLHLESGDRLSFRVTGVGTLASQVLLALSEQSRYWTLRMGASFCVELEIVRWSVFPSEHQWAGLIDMNDLFESAWRAAETEPDRVKLQFCSPTTFEMSAEGSDGWGNWMHLPVPRLVFGSLRNRVLACTDLAEPQFPSGSMDRHVALGQFTQLSSEMLHFQRHGFHRAGFVGDCEFLFDRKLPEPCRVWLHLLANLAFYTGVGRETTKGMGQVRREPFDMFSYRGKQV